MNRTSNCSHWISRLACLAVMLLGAIGYLTEGARASGAFNSRLTIRMHCSIVMTGSSNSQLTAQPTVKSGWAAATMPQCSNLAAQDRRLGGRATVQDPMIAWRIEFGRSKYAYDTYVNSARIMIWANMDKADVDPLPGSFTSKDIAIVGRAASHLTAAPGIIICKVSTTNVNIFDEGVVLGLFKGGNAGRFWPRAMAGSW